MQPIQPTFRSSLRCVGQTVENLLVGVHPGVSPIVGLQWCSICFDALLFAGEDGCGDLPGLVAAALVFQDPLGHEVVQVGTLGDWLWLWL